MKQLVLARSRPSAKVSSKLTSFRGTRIELSGDDMAHFDVDDVTRIAREAASEHSHAIKIAGVVLGGEGNYVEILVNLEGCHAEPCQLSLGVFRNASESMLKNAVSEQLRRHLIGIDLRGTRKADADPVR
jgi:hypothetical protein